MAQHHGKASSHHLALFFFKYISWILAYCSDYLDTLGKPECETTVLPSMAAQLRFIPIWNLHDLEVDRTSLSSSYRSQKSPSHTMSVFTPLDTLLLYDPGAVWRLYTPVSLGAFKIRKLFSASSWSMQARCHTFVPIQTMNTVW